MLNWFLGLFYPLGLNALAVPSMISFMCPYMNPLTAMNWLASKDKYVSELDETNSAPSLN